MELEFNEEQYECKLIETKKNVIIFKIDEERENKKKSDSIKINRSDSFNCDMSKHIFNPDKSSPDSKFFMKGLLRLDKY